jgi:hypothetical protein
VLKLKTAEFKILTRSPHSLSPPSSCEELTAISLRERVGSGPQKRFRLVGVGSNFLDPEEISAQTALFGRLSSYSLPFDGIKQSYSLSVALGRFYRHSPYNVLLIALQKPNASYVAG